ncbi:MAG TPA: DUF1176 domain-containing protein [Lichenihabitans sp.]|nr:DUF1176 domain-containing protein [Lichenihabitans sp.]
MKLGLAALLIVCTLPALAQGAKSFSDWSVGCDNLRSCTALGLSGADASDPIFLRLTRDGSADAAPHWSIGWSLDDLPPGTHIKLGFDDGALPGLLSEPQAFSADKQPFVYEVPASGTAAFLASLRKAASLKAELVLPAGKMLPDSQPKTAAISLKGAVAALIWLDDTQKRIGTTTALVKPGDRPASAVPALPPEPVVHAAPTPLERKLPGKEPAAVTKALKAAGCDDGLSGDAAMPDVARLSASTVLWGAACQRAAYNATTLYFAIEKGTPKPLDFEAPKGEAQDPPNTLVNPSFDPKTMTMTAFSKDRGVGDCGSLGTWVWDGQTFALTEFSAMHECRGVVPDGWPTLYRARVER